MPSFAYWLPQEEGGAGSIAAHWIEPFSKYGPRLPMSLARRRNNPARRLRPDVARGAAVGPGVQGSQPGGGGHLRICPDTRYLWPVHRVHGSGAHVRVPLHAGGFQGAYKRRQIQPDPLGPEPQFVSRLQRPGTVGGMA